MMVSARSIILTICIVVGSIFVFFGILFLFDEKEGSGCIHTGNQAFDDAWNAVFCETEANIGLSLLLIILGIVILIVGGIIFSALVPGRKSSGRKSGKNASSSSNNRGFGTHTKRGVAYWKISLILTLVFGIGLIIFGHILFYAKFGIHYQYGGFWGHWGQLPNEGNLIMIGWLVLFAGGGITALLIVNQYVWHKKKRRRYVRKSSKRSKKVKK